MHITSNNCYTSCLQSLLDSEQGSKLNYVSISFFPAGTTDGTVSALLYKGLSGIFVVLSALLMFVIVMLIACLCIHRRKVKKGIASLRMD